MTKFWVGLLVASFLSLLGGKARAEQSISDLTRLAPHLIRYYDCSVMLIKNEGLKEGSFRAMPRGGEAANSGVTLTDGDDTITAGANSQLLRLEWRRKGAVITHALTMIQNSSTQSYVLIIFDPADDSQQANISCSAVTFAGGGK